MKVGVEGSLKSLEVLKKRRQPPERHRMFFVTAASQKLSVITDTGSSPLMRDEEQSSLQRHFPQ